MARKFAEGRQGTGSDAKAGGGSRGGDVSEEVAGRGNDWSIGPAAFARAFPFTSGMLLEPCAR
jgi:hypothetical protein